MLVTPKRSIDPADTTNFEKSRAISEIQLLVAKSREKKYYRQCQDIFLKNLI